MTIFPTMTALENVRVALQRFRTDDFAFWKSGRVLHGLDREERHAQAMGGLEQIGLQIARFADLADQLGGGRTISCHRLSGRFHMPNTTTLVSRRSLNGLSRLLLGILLTAALLLAGLRQQIGPAVAIFKM